MKELNAAVEKAIPEYSYYTSENISSGSTDMCDLCSVMPVIHPYSGGANGKFHGNDYQIVDPVAACVDCAKMQMEMLLILLSDGAARAKEIIENYQAPFASIEEYLAFMDSLARTGDRITYNEAGTDKVDIS